MRQKVAKALRRRAKEDFNRAANVQKRYDELKSKYKTIKQGRVAVSQLYENDFCPF